MSDEEMPEEAPEVTFTIEEFRDRPYTGTDPTIQGLIDVDLITEDGFHFTHTIESIPGKTDTRLKVRNYLRENWDAILAAHPDHEAVKHQESVDMVIKVNEPENPLYDEPWFNEMLEELMSFDLDELKQIAQILDMDLDFDAISSDSADKLCEDIAKQIGEDGEIPDPTPEPEPEQPPPFKPEGPLEMMFLDAWRELPGGYGTPAYLVLRTMDLKQRGSGELTKLADSHNIPGSADMNDLLLAFEIAKRQGDATEDELKAVKKYTT